MWVFYVFASLLVLQSAVSLRGGLRYLAYVRRENLAALFRQDYTAYEIVFVVDSSRDASLGVIEEVRREFGQRVASRVCVAGEARDCGQKVHNLRAAVGAADAKSELFVFVDSDARPRRGWLRQ